MGLAAVPTLGACALGCALQGLGGLVMLGLCGLSGGNRNNSTPWGNAVLAAQGATCLCVLLIPLLTSTAGNLMSVMGTLGAAAKLGRRQARGEEYALDLLQTPPLEDEL